MKAPYQFAGLKNIIKKQIQIINFVNHLNQCIVTARIEEITNPADRLKDLAKFPRSIVMSPSSIVSNSRVSPAI